jgi:hypothetical protein
MWNNKKPTNNYDDVRSIIASRVLDHPLARHVGYPNNKDRLYELQSMRATEGRKSSLYFMTVEFRCAGTSVSMDIECKDADDWPSSRCRDEEGNEFMRCEFSAKINWPAHGGTDPSKAIARLSFYNQVALLAAELLAELQAQTVWELTRTKEEREAEEAQKAAEKVKNAVLYAIDNVRKSMRVGDIHGAKLEDLADVPDGTHEHEFNDGKKYQLMVNKTGIGYLVTRIA